MCRGADFPVLVRTISTPSTSGGDTCGLFALFGEQACSEGHIVDVCQLDAGCVVLTCGLTQAALSKQVFHCGTCCHLAPCFVPVCGLSEGQPVHNLLASHVAVPGYCGVQLLGFAQEGFDFGSERLREQRHGKLLGVNRIGIDSMCLLLEDPHGLSSVPLGLTIDDGLDSQPCQTHRTPTPQTGFGTPPVRFTLSSVSATTTKNISSFARPLNPKKPNTHTPPPSYGNRPPYKNKHPTKKYNIQSKS